jgi:hypothetical protein
MGFMVKYWQPLIMHGRLRKLGARRLTAGLVSLAAATAFLTTVAPAPAGAATIAVGAAAPLPQGAVRLGALSASTVLRVDVVLAPRDPAALTQYATDVATPGSPLYRNYLPAGEFPARFGPTSAAIAGVRSTLRARGLHPGVISANHLSIPVTATAGQLQSAFTTSLARYRLPGGRTGFANATAPVLPAAAAAHVQAVVGLDSLIQSQSQLTRPVAPVARGRRAAPSPDVVTGGPQPCAAATNNANSNPPFFGLTADQLAFAYKFSGLYHAKDFGRGVTVGIVELGEPNLASDITAFQKCYGLHNKVSYQSVDGFRKTGPGVGEAALDIETVSVMAPAASVLVYRAPNTGAGEFDEFSTIDAQDRVRVVSMSFGLCEKFVPASFARALHVLFEQAAVQGQTIAVSSGDRGSEGCLQVDNKPAELSSNSPASDPFVLSVGGTSIVSNNPVTSPAFQVVWNDAFDGNGAGGGGKSTLFKMPQYQKSFLKVKSGVREQPDVSADADPETGYVIFHQGQWLTVGGTSASTPLWAALLALTDAQCAASPVGFVNPTLYHVASAADPVPVMNDIVANSNFPGNVNNDFTGRGGGHYAVRAGYDMGTGVGVPLAAALAGQLCKFSAQRQGYWLTTASGQVYAFHAPGRGSLAGKHLASSVVGIAGDPGGDGYWLATAKGHVYAFHAPSHGSVTGRLASPVVGIAADHATGGYWLVTAKGHVYAFHAPGHGSLTGASSPVVGIAADPFTSGYWLVTANGKVHAFDAGRYPAKNIKSKVAGITADPLHQGYWVVTASGTVFGFNVASAGSMPHGAGSGRIVGIAADRASGGYWLATATGNIGAIKAAWHGAHPGQPAKNPVVGVASTQ